MLNTSKWHLICLLRSFSAVLLDDRHRVWLLQHSKRIKFIAQLPNISRYHLHSINSSLNIDYDSIR